MGIKCSPSFSPQRRPVHRDFGARRGSSGGSLCRRSTWGRRGANRSPEPEFVPRWALRAQTWATDAGVCVCVRGSRRPCAGGRCALPRRPVAASTRFFETTNPMPSTDGLQEAASAAKGAQPHAHSDVGSATSRPTPSCGRPSCGEAASDPRGEFRVAHKRVVHRARTWEPTKF